MASYALQLLVACPLYLFVSGCADAQPDTKGLSTSAGEELQTRNETTGIERPEPIQGTPTQPGAAEPTMEEFAMGTTAYQLLSVASRQGGYGRFSSGVIRSKAALDTFIATQDPRLGMHPFYSSLGSAQVDFSKEALVLLRVNIPSESIDVSFKGGWIRRVSFGTSTRRELAFSVDIEYPSGGGDDASAHYCFPVIVNTDLVDGITLLVGGKETFMASFDDEPKAIAVRPPPNLQNVTPRKRRSEERAITAHALEALRLRGNREIVPSASALASLAEFKGKRVSIWRFCVNTEGRVEKLTNVRSSGAEAFETQLKTAIGKWRFKNKERAVDILPACTTYTFVVDV